MNRTAGVFVLILATAIGTANADAVKLQPMTVPIVLDHKRITVEISFKRADGSLRPARAWVDTGGTTVVMTETLARELGVDLSAMPANGTRPFAPTARDLDIVGLTLRAESDGSFTVAGVVTRDGRPLIAAVQPGDKLVRVDALDVLNAPMGTVIDSLRGQPGAVRVLEIEREGKKIVVKAAVDHLP